MTTWPDVSKVKFFGLDAVTGPTPLGLIKEHSGEALPQAFPDLLKEMPDRFGNPGEEAPQPIPELLPFGQPQVFQITEL